MIPKLKKEEGWHTVDLHVHTPASKDYKGKKDRDEYKEIIMKTDLSYKKEDTEKKNETSKINLIAITDHNSVDGFKTIMEMKKETSDLIIKLKQRDPNLDYIKKLQKEEDLFNSVHILMGIEIKPDPGIHLLVIFHEEIKLELVETFLFDGLGAEYESLKGNPEPMLKWNIAQTFEEIQKRFTNKAFVIAPHVDSNCGLYESLKNLHQPRIIAFKHPLLKAISFNNPEVRDKIKKLLQSPDYKRDYPIAFLQDSDYHGESGNYIGFSHSKILSGNKRISYSSLLNALPKEKNVICSVDFVEEIYNDLIEGFSIQRFMSTFQNKLIFNESDYRLLCDTVCSYLNSDGGIIEMTGTISISGDKSEVVDEFKQKLEQILASRLKPIPKIYSTKILQMSNTKHKILVLFNSSSKLFMSDGKILILKNGAPCPAESNEIECIVARNLNKRYGKSVEEKLEEVTFETKRISKIQRSYPIAVKYDNKLMRNLGRVFNIDFLELHNKIEPLQQLYEKYGNGVADGNLEVSFNSSSPRLPDSYLRYSMPTYTIDETTLTEKTAFLQTKSGLIVVPRGGIMLNSDGKYLHVFQPTILLRSKTSEDLLSYIAWFKSSFFLWYCATIVGDRDFFKIILNDREKIPLPNQTLLDCLHNTTNHIKNLLLDETNFLKESTKLTDKGDKDEAQRLTEKHNKAADSTCRLMDIEIFKCFGFSSEEALEIYKTLKYLDIYEFNIGEKTEYQKNLEELDKNLPKC